MENTPLIIDPRNLENIRNTYSNLVLVDLCQLKTYEPMHIEGAVHLKYSNIVHQNPPVMGLLPDPNLLSEALGQIGITRDSFILAYDDEGGGKACRLLWTLDVLGHREFALLDGGIVAWLNEGFPVSKEISKLPESSYGICKYENAVATKDYILQNLDNPNVTLLDCRTEDEYFGRTARALHSGHIPGAVNMDWVLALDVESNLRVKTKENLEHLLNGRGIRPENEIVVYCHSNHRSAHTYILLKHLGFPNIRAYPGSWSEWGNDTHLPYEA